MPALLDATPDRVGPEVSVIIPTYNRKNSLLRTLASLSNQTLPPSEYEVVVIDDGSTDATAQIAEISWPFELVYMVQQNQGAAAARNHGAEISRGGILVFIDDDITLGPGYLAALAQVHRRERAVISMGVFQPYLTGQDSVFATLHAQRVAAQAAASMDRFVSFAECVSNNLAIRRQDFFAVGLWRDVLGDGPTLWGDVEFGCRAWKQGYRFLRVARARLVHRDRNVVSLAAACQRAHHVSRLAPLLFQCQPEIREYLPMFADKGPIEWHRDPPRLIMRKLARQLASSGVAVATMNRLVSVLEQRRPSSPLLHLLYRWIVSASIYKGYREGLRNPGACPR